MKQKIKLFCDLFPLAAFFVAYKYSGVMAATITLVISTLFTTALAYYYERKISWIPIITVALVSVMGGLTIFSGNELFIKIKPTLINGILALILMGGLLCRKLLLKQMLGASMEMSDQAWKIFSLRWIGLFIGLALLNEVIWRHASTDVWVSFKVFGLLPITLAFMLAQYPFLKRHAIVHRPDTSD